ncbi:putative ribonuclease H-like domain-containing protein, partial [Tanacetum coccineum]
ETSEAKDSADKPKVVRKNNGALIIEDWLFDSEEEDVPQAKIQKKTVKPSFAKIEFVKSKEQVKSPRKTTVKQGSNFEIINKACYVCGSFDHLQYDCDNHQRQFNNKKMVKPVWNYTQRVNHQIFSRMTHPSPKRNMVPKAVLMRSGLVSLTTARPVNTAQPKTTVNSARPMTNVFNKAHSTVRRPINNKTATKNSNFNQRVNTVSGKNVNTARPKAVVNVARPKAVLNAVKGNQVNVVKASACWVWKPKTKGNPQQDLEDKGVIDSGCSRHMTRNMSYLTDFEEIDGGYVAFGGNPKGGKLTGGGTIKTGNLDFKNVYFVRELQFNLFSVSQMCDKKNSVLFNDTECIVLSPNFKLTNESHVLLKVPRKNNMYSVDLKNIVPKGGLTCLFAKATSNESKLWHRRLGHINFKTMNKLIKGNLVRGLPLKLFEINQTCVACQKGKKHRASCKSKTLAGPLSSQDSKSSLDAGFKPLSDGEKKVNGDPSKEDERYDQKKDDNVNSTNNINTAIDGNSTNNVNVVSSTVNAAGIEVNVVDDDKDVGTEADMNNLDAFMPVSPIPTTRVHKDNPFSSAKNKSKDERGIVIKNKARLVDQGCTQEEGIDYDEFFAPVARIEAIRLFLAYTSFKDFVVYQMDVKSAFLYGKIEEEVYVCQPLGFEDPDFPDRVYKVEKTLYGLHQAPRAWYETLSTYLLDNGFQRGKIDKTLFIRRDKGDILLVQVYVDDIIFGSIKKSLCTEFKKMIHKKFQMISMGELTFFLGLTPMETQKPLLKDEDGEEVDVHLYRSMIGSLMYLTSSRPDIMFIVCACARYQVNPKVSHLHAVKRIFRYLKGQPKLGLWYPKDSPFDLVAYTDSDYAGA